MNSPITPSPQSRTLVASVLKRIARVKGTNVAVAMGKDESTVSWIVSGEGGIRLADLHAFLDALDLKVVDNGQVCVDKAVFESYRLLAARALTQPASLEWGPDEPMLSVEAEA